MGKKSHSNQTDNRLKKINQAARKEYNKRNKEGKEDNNEKESQMRL